MSIRDVRNKKIAVLGLARSGLAAASLLLRKGAQVVGSDLLNREELSQEIFDLEHRGLRTEFGGHPDHLLDEVELFVVSPGVPLDQPICEQARSRGIPVVGEIEIASWFCSAPIIAVTGSNGKTTTTELLGSIFRQGGWEAEVAGNIGSPFSVIADGLSPQGVAILEVSSFQLESIVEFKPEVSVLLNFSPDHLDRHPGYSAYVSAKARIMENQDEQDVAVVNADDPQVMALTENIVPRIIPFSVSKSLDEGVTVSGGTLVARFAGKEEAICRVKTVRLLGPHNVSNVAAAVAVALQFDVDRSMLQKILREFSGVEHRLERIAEVDGVTFVNDSKATNVVSVQCALQSFQEPIVLLAGGREKGADFSPLRSLVGDKVKLLILLGEAAPKLQEALGDVVETVTVQTMDEAVRKGFHRAQRGDVVLLSPACASFDMYRNYEERGASFKEAVHRLSIEGTR